MGRDHGIRHIRRAPTQESRADFRAAVNTYAKGDDQFPVKSPGFIVRGDGCHVWDVDYNEFIEYGMGLRAVTLGHGYRPVVEAAYRAMQLGTNFGRPSPLEVEYAERLVDLFEAADMVKFAKNGSDVTSAAVKLARAYHRPRHGRSMRRPAILLDGRLVHREHADVGRDPSATRDQTVKFNYNDLDSIRRLFADHPGRWRV